MNSDEEPSGKRPRIVNLGGYEGVSWTRSNEDRGNAPQWEFTGSEIIIDPLYWPFEPNQSAEFYTDEGGQIELTVLQEGSTPGIRLEKPINIPRGEYTMTVVGLSENPDTFFPWAMDDQGVRLTPTIHLSESEGPVSVNFSLEKDSGVIFGVLCHRQKSGDRCFIRSISVNKLILTDAPISEGNFRSLSFSNFIAHQSTELSESPEGIIVTSKPISTPGAYSVIDVKPNSTLSINVSVSVSYPSVCFLYIADADTGIEVINRGTIFESSESLSQSELFSSFKVPSITHRIRIGLLFSTVTAPNLHRMIIHRFEIVQHHLISEVVDRAYVLNLPEESGKLAHCFRQADRLGITLDPWIATNGNSGKPHSDWLEYMQLPWSEYDVSLGRKAIDKPGAWGYLLSMKGIFEDAMAKEYRAIAVFDDDFVLSNSFDHRFSKLMEIVNDDWKVIYLGASQWLWDGIETDSRPYYSPNENTNGTFAVIYHHSVFREIIAEIDRMDAPFDAGPLRRVVLGSGKGSSFVAHPSLAIAKLEKPGIRESRNQIEFSKRFGWNLHDFPAWFNQWEPHPVIVRDDSEQVEKSNKEHLITAVTTVNRLSYLKKFIQGWNSTKDSESNHTLIVADDGSTDGTLEWLTTEIEPLGFRLVVIRNDGRGIARQTNSILDFIITEIEDYEIAFFCNDDINFLKKGWDREYSGAIRDSGYGHLVYFNPEWKDPSHYVDSENSPLLFSYCAPRDAMGCFYTLTPDIIDRLGFFDEASFPVRGHSHVDYTIRACRIEANDENFLFDFVDSNEYIGMMMRDGYKRTHRTITIKERELTTSREALSKREEILVDQERIFIERGW